MVRESRSAVSPDGGASPLLWFTMVRAAHARASSHGGALSIPWSAMVRESRSAVSPDGEASPLLWFAMVRDDHAPASPLGGVSPFLWFAMVGDIPRLAAPTTGGADASIAARSTAASRARKSADIPRSRAIGAAPEGTVAAIVSRAGGRSYFRRYARAMGGFDRCGIDISAAPTAELSHMSTGQITVALSVAAKRRSRRALVRQNRCVC